MADYDVNKLTKLGALKALAEKIKGDYAKQTDFTALSKKVDGLVTAGGEPNVIEKIKIRQQRMLQPQSQQLSTRRLR